VVSYLQQLVTRDTAPPGIGAADLIDKELDKILSVPGFVKTTTFKSRYKSTVDGIITTLTTQLPSFPGAPTSSVSCGPAALNKRSTWHLVRGILLNGSTEGEEGEGVGESCPLPPRTTSTALASKSVLEQGSTALETKVATSRTVSKLPAETKSAIEEEIPKATLTPAAAVVKPEPSVKPKPVEEVEPPVEEKPIVKPKPAIAPKPVEADTPVVEPKPVVVPKPVPKPAPAPPKPVAEEPEPVAKKPLLPSFLKPKPKTASKSKSLFHF